jgi:Putative beta-barrel porin-2, OmpL-like. bbp2
MKPVLFSAATLALTLSLGWAGTEKDMKKMVEEQGIYVETAKPGVVLSGYVDAGYTYNFDGPTRRSVARAGSDSGAKGEFNLNSFKLAIEKPLGDRNEYAAGFRVDLVYGEDASTITTNANSNSAGDLGANGAGVASDFAVQQAFVQFRAPIGNGIDFRVGKIVTFIGYEVLERPANINITYGNMWQNMIPATHTGAAAIYKFNDTIDVKTAVINGWQDDGTGIPVASNANNLSDTYASMTSINVNAPGNNANIQNTFYVGAGGDQSIFETNDGDVNYLYNVWGVWKPTFANEKLLLGFDYNYGGAPNSRGGAAKSGYENWYGLALYSKYQFTDIFSLAGRAEYIHNDNGNKWTTTDGNGTNAFAFPARDGLGNEIYCYTITAGFDVWENMLLRCEYRADWGNDWITGTSAEDLGNGRYGVSHLAAVQVVYSF